MLSTIIAILIAGPISKYDTKEPDLSYVSQAEMFDIERCLMDLPKEFVPAVARQPDRPDEVTLAYPGEYGLTTGRIDLKRVEGGTMVTSWSIRKSKVLACAPDG